MAKFAPGSRYGSFQIIAEIGVGLTGTVYKATYQKDGTTVALKFLEKRDESVKSYFFNEMGLLRRAKEQGRKQPHLVEYVASYTTQEPFCLATRFYEGGRELGTLLQEGISPGLGLRIIEQVAGALDYLHYGHPDHPVIHRDVKPANIMVNQEGDALLIDLSAGRHPGFMLENERGLGTPPYMPPEQYDGDEQPQTDQFALAMVAYQVLSGKTLLGMKTDRDLKQMTALRDNGYARVRTGLRSMPAAAEVIARAVNFDWQQRYPSCEEFAYDLRLALGRDGVNLEVQAPATRSRGYGQWLGYGAMGLLALLAITALFFAWPSSKPVIASEPTQPPTATIVQTATARDGPGRTLATPAPTEPQLEPTSSLLPTPTPPPQVKIAASGCSLREQPSTEAKIIAYSSKSRMVPAGVSVNLLEQQDNWLKLQLADGRIGWCPSERIVR